MEHDKQTNHIVKKQLSQVQDLLDQGKKAKEIGELLDMKPRTVEYRIAQLRKRDKEYWKEIALESLEDRAFKILESLQYCIDVNKDIAENSKDDKARIEASKLIVETNIATYQFLENGPLSLTPVAKRAIATTTKKALPPKSYTSSAGLG